MMSKRQLLPIPMFPMSLRPTLVPHDFLLVLLLLLPPPFIPPTSLTPKPPPSPFLRRPPTL
ncbi:hypothetical protein HMI55_002315 [Coelomomyces lativittatus]|nr:hypothetical protein HMI55_002315 [Coelomomyces lativittatus]